MAKKKAVKRRVRKNKRGSYMLPLKTVGPDDLFTMCLSMQTFATQTLAKSKVKVNNSVLLEKISNALIDTIYATEDKPIYNVAADAIAAAYLTHKRGDKKTSVSLLALAFESPDCENLLEALVAVNAKSIGVKMVADDTMDSNNFSLNTDNEPPPEDGVTDMSDNMVDDAGSPDEAVDTSSNMMSAASAFKKLLNRKLKDKRKKVKAGSADDYQINYGIDSPQNDLTDDDGLDTFIDDGAEQLLEVEPLGAGDDSIPDTMRLGIPTDINEIESDYPDNLPKVEMLSSRRVEKLAKTNPEIVAIANKIAMRGGGGAKGKELAHRFMREAISG